LDTIFSSASSSQKSAIKIIRVSGNKTKVLPKIFSFKPTQPRVASLRKIYDSENNVIDSVLIIYFPGPKTVTGEDVMEFHFHGSSYIEKKIYEALNKIRGVRVAGRGEFTKRAFLNGILDLTQAEGLNDLINSETEIQFKLSMSQYEGVLSKKINSWRVEIVHLLSKLEALIDFSDEELPNEIQENFNFRALKILNEMKTSIKHSNYGERIRNGFLVTIIGRPNVGKSSLINYLSDKKVAIVTDEEGTTRDVLEVIMDFEGFPVVLNDTAGIRNAKSKVEKIGIGRALEKAKISDVILVLSDSEDFSYPELKTTGKKILVHTKSDLGTISNKNIHNISIKKRMGIDKLIKEIVHYLSTLNPKEDGLLTRKRHKQAVKKSICAMNDLLKIDLNINPELASENLRIVAKEIGNITNVIDVEEILDDIFNSFCIGK
jgi:tRNA modification GTPase